MLTAGQCGGYSCNRRRSTTAVAPVPSSTAAGTPPSFQLSLALSSLSSAPPRTSNWSGEAILTYIFARKPKQCLVKVKVNVNKESYEVYVRKSRCQELFLYGRCGRPHIFQDSRGLGGESSALDNQCSGSFSPPCCISGLAFNCCIFQHFENLKI